MSIPSGTQLGPYEILGSLGAGGMGEVYRARHVRLGREVALKVLSSEFSKDPDRLARFEQEARSASALNHPNIVSIYEIETAGETSYIAMELVEGKTLREVLAAGALPVKKTLKIAAELADGLAKAHSVGIIHRDLKPENIMISRDHFVKILDFGLAKLMPQHSDSSSQMPTVTHQGTSPGVVLGTVGYMSPEQARGVAVDFHSDQFSLGTILYEMATGTRPFKGDSAAQVMTAIIEDDAAPVTQLNARTPAPLRWVIERCMAKDANERYVSTSDLARDLRQLRDHLSEVTSSSEAAMISPAQGWRKYQRLIPWAAMGASLLLAVVCLLWHRSEQQIPTVRTLTFSGDDFFPSASPDGRTVAFVSARDGTSRIWLKQFVGGDESPLTQGPDSFPRFSPDASMILFVRSESGRSSIYRVAAVGGEPRKLIDNAREADWSPDGTQIAFVRGEFSAGNVTGVVGVAGADGGGIREVRKLPGEIVGSPRWSPDGRFIAVVNRQTGVAGNPRRSIILISPDGKGQRNLETTFVGGEISAIAWADDGNAIIYSQPESVSAVGLIAGLGGGLGLVASPASRVIKQSINSSQAQILFSTQSASGSVDLLAPGRLVLDSLNLRRNLKEIVLSEASSPAAGKWLTHGASVDRQPYYSPDGEWVLFSSSRSGNNDVWKVSTKTGVVRRLTDNEADDWDPAYTPDGKKLLWSSNRSGHFEIWIAEPDGSEARQVSNDGEDAENPSATADGWIFYASGSPSKQGLWKMRMDGSQASRVVSGSAGWPDCSPDGRFVLYHVFAGTKGATIKVVRTADGAPQGFSALGGRARWIRGGRAIAFVRYIDEMSSLHSQDFVPGEQGSNDKILVKANPEQHIETFHISPDGTRAVLTLSDVSRSLILAEGVSGVRPNKRKRQ